MIISTFTAGSRLMLVAPHPDDEALACSVTLQRAVRTCAAVRIVYATDGDDNPWPQRVVERKWHLSAADRKRWGKLRRAEALAALRVLGVRASDARFLALPDQGLTNLLKRDCGSTLERFATIIRDWSPTHLLVPSIADTHPDHSALAVMLRLVLAELPGSQMSVWSYVVHGESPAFFARAQQRRPSEAETAIKVRAIRCHKTQIKLSRRRFLAYAARPERLLKLHARETTIADGSIRSISRQPHTLRLGLQLSVKPTRAAEPTLNILGRDVEEALRCLSVQLPVRSCRIELRDAATERSAGRARYLGNAFAGELTIPIDNFSSDPALFVKLERRSWFFDEAGWLEIPAAIYPRQVIPSNIAQPSLAIR
jgi:LmbE family N-acetylglucosaminyl deacetylase